MNDKKNEDLWEEGHPTLPFEDETKDEETGIPTVDDDSRIGKGDGNSQGS